MNKEALKEALGNIKKVAKKAIVAKYKAKKEPPKTEPEKPKDEKPEAEPIEPEAEADEDEDEPEEKPKKQTELIVLKRGESKKEIPSGGFAPPAKKRGRPPKQK